MADDYRGCKIHALLKPSNRFAHKAGPAVIQTEKSSSIKISPALPPEAPDRLFGVQQEPCCSSAHSSGEARGRRTSELMATFEDQILYEADFFRTWQRVSDRSVDLILTDPPYGAITRGQPWDVRPDYHVLAWILSNLTQPTGQVAIFSNFQTAAEIQDAFGRYFDFRFSWFWVKPSVIPINNTQPANDVELIMVYKRKGALTGDMTFNLDQIKTVGDPYSRPGGKSQNRNPTRGNGGNLPEQFVNATGKRFPRSVLYYPNKPCLQKAERTGHPTQKPVDMLEYILKGLTNSGDAVLDPFAGSASSLVACYRLGRRGIGFELNEEYFEMARNRLEQEMAQGVLA